MIYFEWDESKATSNKRKHGISLEDAMETFYDPNAQFDQDRVIDGELRWQVIGVAAGVIMLNVAHTVREQGQHEIIRIISARRANGKERERYEQNR